eukprot:FR742462.1.p1 GENE.FR742462.1~~FR742462.1.p1  ORF type:complete len:265 (+),score=42.37 FR742462.1:78-797(+)
MGSLLVKDLGAAQRAKRQKELSTLFDALVEEGTQVLQAQRVSLWMVDNAGGKHKKGDPVVVTPQVSKGTLPSDANLDGVFREYDSGGDGYITSAELSEALVKCFGFKLNKNEVEQMMKETSSLRDADGNPVLAIKDFRNLIKKRVLRSSHAQNLRPGGIKYTVVDTGKVLNIPAAHLDPRFNKNWDRYTGFRTRSIVAVPIFDKDDEEKVVGVIVAKNKNGERSLGGWYDHPGGFLHCR